MAARAVSFDNADPSPAAAATTAAGTAATEESSKVKDMDKDDLIPLLVRDVREECVGEVQDHGAVTGLNRMAKVYGRDGM